MPTNPPTRRRRLIDAVTSISKPSAKNYSAVPSSSSRPADRNKGQTFGLFKPVDDKYPYVIQVARDGSMIAAVPADDRADSGSGKNLRSSPILFSDARAVSPSLTEKTNRNAFKQGWSRQGLLEARGKQRSKLKNRSDYAKDSSSGLGLPFASVADVKTKSLQQAMHRNNEKRRSKVRWDLTELNKQQMQQSSSGDAAKATSEKRDDESFSSFPILSPAHKFEESFASRDGGFSKAAGSKTNTNRPARVNGAIATKSTSSNAVRATKSAKPQPASKPTSPAAVNKTKHVKSQPAPNNSSTNPKPPSPSPTSTPHFQTLLQKRIHEIQSEQSHLMQSISKKEMIERTLISAIDENLDKNRKRFRELEEELEVIKWHLTLSPKDGQRKGFPNDPHANAKTPILHSSNKTSSTTESIGDPSLTMIDSTNNSLLSARDAKRKNMGGAGITITGLDPPARPSPVPAKHPAVVLKKDPEGPRISAVLRGDEALGVQKQQKQKQTKEMPVRPIRPVPRHLGTIVQQIGKQQQTRDKIQQQHQSQQQQQQRQRSIPQKPTNQPFSSKRITSSFIKSTDRRRMKKNVHFKLPDEHESVELKFVNDSPSDDLINSQSEENWPSSMNGNFDQHQDNQNWVGNNHGDSSNYFPPNRTPQSLKSHQDTRPPSGITQMDDQSWQGSQYDIETYDETTGNLISSEHYDTFQWRDKDHHIVTSEHYSSENHHHGYGSRGQTSAFRQYESNGVSSDSVEADPDLGFIHAVAAVVIQTAVRRFLAEIRVMERLYAVQVIQTTICRWMARRTNPDANHYRVARKGVSRMPSPVWTSPVPRKRVMFKDEYLPFYHAEATKIQRCFRGWWAREALVVDHFAAEQIQRVFRGWWAREALEVDRYCAVEIQRRVRGYLGRMSYIYDLYCIIVAQSVARRYLAFYTSAIRLANILYIQAIWRGYRVRSELMRYVEQGQEVAATMIQAQYRRYDAQMNFINQLADILIVQSVARRWLTLRKMKKRKLQYGHQHLHGYQNQQHGYHNGSHHQQPHSYSNQRNGSISRAINNLQHYPEARQHGYNQPNDTSSQWKGVQTPHSSTHSPKKGRPPMWQPSNSKPEYPPPKSDQHPNEYDTFLRPGRSEEWYDGNKSEASEMLTNWARRRDRRSSKSSNFS